MTTGLDVFDTTVQETNLWLKDIGTYDRHSAYSTLRAVLHAVRNRIGPENAAHLGVAAAACLMCSPRGSTAAQP